MIMEKINYKQYVYYILFVMITASGDALAFKGSIGVNAWEAVCQTVNYMSAIKVGTLMIVFNVLMIVIEALLMKKIKFTMILQLIVSLLVGSIVNVIVYLFLGNLSLTTYYSRLLMTILGFIISATGNGLLMNCQLAPFPYEGLCEQIALKINVDFAKLRQVFDIISVAFCITVSFIGHYQLAIREGTIISMIIYSPIMGFVMKKSKLKFNITK